MKVLSIENNFMKMNNKN